MDLDVSVTINELISALSLAVDTEEDTRHYHGWRVALLTALLALQQDNPKSKNLFYAAMLHDIGAAGLPRHIIHYGESHRNCSEPILTAHPLVSAEIIVNIPGLETSALAVVQHHESFDGQGYPQALQGAQIIRDAQLLRMADFVDLKLREEQIYDYEQLMKSIAAERNAMFSREMVELAGAALRRELFGEIRALDRVPYAFATTKDLLGPICLQSGIDAVSATLRVFSQAIDAKHSYTEGHSRRVTRYSVLIGLALGFDQQEITQLEWAGLLHDVGKLSIPRGILDKSSALSVKEYHRIKLHALLTFEIISMITDLQHIAPVAAAHHERMDGAGYPWGLRGEKIPLGARILCVADAFDAMTSNRPYKPDVNAERACEILRQNTGTQFDGDVVKVALPILSNVGISDYNVAFSSGAPDELVAAPSGLAGLI